MKDRKKLTPEEDAMLKFLTEALMEVIYKKAAELKIKRQCLQQQHLSKSNITN